MSRYRDDATAEKRLWQAVAVAEYHEDVSVLEAIRRAKRSP